MRFRNSLISKHFVRDIPVPSFGMFAAVSPITELSDAWFSSIVADIFDGIHANGLERRVREQICKGEN